MGKSTCLVYQPLKETLDGCNRAANEITRELSRWKMNPPEPDDIEGTDHIEILKEQSEQLRKETAAALDAIQSHIAGCDECKKGE